MMTEGRTRRSREERERIVLDSAARLFYARGVHEVGMDELVRDTGLGKATVYRLYPTKDDLVGAYLGRLAGEILALVDAGSGPDADPAAALHRVLDAVEEDLRRPGFRGCPFHNAGVEYGDAAHPARRAARDYRAELRRRLAELSVRVCGGPRGRVLGDRLAVLVDGAYTSAAHLGPDGPAAEGLRLARRLVDEAANGAAGGGAARGGPAGGGAGEDRDEDGGAP
ncbi:TetR/AcrR family transcriptional regulator; helix-turn-helix transcriptional regulator [Streptacidiphilus sp. ASG 303]|uniref:TetR/AcrR family transcriptional regulator n=1 Tax=Streptacidiphilus sp. ASG 303 TaxID=2896847 RepID=UPI001E2D32FB|nr:TetR/AcrR family transcriptional regulator [Streptacidiphilus sp. ASG 303]MCD0485094.1 TetR/AcrR family transcriptional regulator; helix-turn-helix transcriptional regulator [Streptacidiphilus sp. ASG 303]